MKKRTTGYILLTFIVLFISTRARAEQPGKPNWRAGQLTFWTGETQEGTLSYNWSTETVLVQQPDGRVSTFSASQVSSFGWFDFDEHKYRRFVAYTHPAATNNRPVPLFFEIFMDGPLTVVRRMRQPRGLSRRLFNHPRNHVDRPGLAQHTDFFDYYTFDGGHFASLDRFYVDIYTPQLTAYHRELQQYLRAHNINDHALLGRLLLIDRFNFLTQQAAETASARGNARRSE